MRLKKKLLSRSLLAVASLTSAIALTGCGSAAGVLVRNLEQSSSGGCKVRLAIYNNSGVPWTEVGYLIAFRDANKRLVGSVNTSNTGYLEPQMYSTVSHDIRHMKCDRVVTATVEDFSYGMVSGNVIKLLPSTVKIGFKTEPIK